MYFLSSIILTFPFMMYFVMNSKCWNGQMARLIDREEVPSSLRAFTLRPYYLMRASIFDFSQNCHAKIDTHLPCGRQFYRKLLILLKLTSPEVQFLPKIAQLVFPLRAHFYFLCHCHISKAAHLL